MSNWDRKRLYYEIVLPFSRLLEGIELNGFLIDRDKLEELRIDFTNRLAKLQNDIYSIAGEFNIRSPHQLADVLYNRMRIPNYVEDEDYNYKKGVWETTKDEFLTKAEEEWNRKNKSNRKKGTSTDVYSLKKIQAVYNPPIVNLLLEYRTLAKLISSYIEGMSPFIGSDGKIHASYYQNTVIGRPTVSNPNLLTMPSRSEDGKKLKEMFIAPEGYVIVHNDYSGMELRFLAWLANDKVMLPAFNNNTDVHALTASKIKSFNLTYEQAKLPENKNKRFAAKTTNFLIVYGGGYSKLQDTILKQMDIFIPKKQCAEFIDAFHNTYMDVKPLQNKVKSFVFSKGYIENLFGRRRTFPNINRTEDNSDESSIERQAFHHLISSSSSGDYSALKAIRLNKELKNFDGWFQNYFFDGFYITIKENQAQKWAELMTEILLEPEGPVKIQLPTEQKIGRRWSNV